jgi:hypothetical protein
MQMMDRRRLIKSLFAAELTRTVGYAAAQTGTSFDELLAEAMKSPEDFERIRGEKEVFDPFNSKAAAPRVPPSKREIARKAIDLIIFFEVSSQANYTNKLTRPVWPKGQSGVTIGIGYDLGAVRPEWLRNDWKNILDEETIKALEPACQLSGTDAAELIPTLQKIVVPWPQAIEQFEKRLLPLYVGQSLLALPLAKGLTNTSLGALVSLIYNRGANFTSPNPARKEMVAIKDALAAGEYKEIPDLIRKMKRIWKYEDFPGLHKRRNLEAALFEEGIT